MIKGYQSKILDIYSEIREREEDALKKRREEIEKKVPYIIEKEKEIAKLCVELSISTIKNIENRDIYLKELKEKITNLRMEKTELLVGNGYSADYLELHYNCKRCKDTGFMGNKRCSCYNQMMIDVYYRNSDFKNMLSYNNFDNFSLEYYSTKKDLKEMVSARKNIERVLSISTRFIETFNSSNENLLFYGSAGTGKTFLSHCIAKELLNKGYLVVYKTAGDLIQSLRRIRFNHEEELEDLLLDCDLLIIDDLGTEETNDFSNTEFFNFLNKKLLTEKKMIISTNFTLEDILKNYSDRIASRLIGNFTPCRFFGDDIRIKKNMMKKR